MPQVFEQSLFLLYTKKKISFKKLPLFQKQTEKIIFEFEPIFFDFSKIFVIQKT